MPRVIGIEVRKMASVLAILWEEGGPTVARQDGDGAEGRGRMPHPPGGQRGQKWVPWRGKFPEFGFHAMEKRHNLASMACDKRGQVVSY